MLWDQAIVRNRYKLRPDPESFESYHRFGWKLLHPVTRHKTANALRQLERAHARRVMVTIRKSWIDDRDSHELPSSTRS
jgi:hypothetical protein